MSPLVCLDQEEKKKHPRAYQFLDFTFKHLNLFYNFRSLYQYKVKFNPDAWEPNYLIASTRSLGPMAYYSLFRVLLPHGITSIIYSSILGILRRFDPNFILSKLSSNKIVLRGVPQSFFEFLFRIKTTLVLITTDILFYSVANDSSGHLHHRFINEYAYRWSRVLEHGLSIESFQMLIIPSLLHWNFTHLFTNLIFLTLFVGLLEMLAGSTLVSVAYLCGILFSNPITSIVITPILYLFSPQSAAHFMDVLDVGSSLGIFSCIGVLAYLLRYTKTFLIIITICVGVISYYENDLLSLNHLTAIAIGLGLARFFIPKELS